MSSDWGQIPGKAASNTSRILVTAAALSMSASCAVREPFRYESGAVIGACLAQLENLAEQSLSPEADRAYVYAKGSHYWVYFTHGDPGTFGRRSPDYRVLLDCGAIHGAAPETLFLGKPMQDPLLDTPDRDYFVTPAGSTELRFVRSGERFEYCCSQPFRRSNLLIHNPAFALPD